MGSSAQAARSAILGHHLGVRATRGKLESPQQDHADPLPGGKQQGSRERSPPRTSLPQTDKALPLVAGSTGPPWLG